MYTFNSVLLIVRAMIGNIIHQSFIMNVRQHFVILKKLSTYDAFSNAGHNKTS